MKIDNVWGRIDEIAARVVTLDVEMHWRHHLASNLAIGAALCRADRNGQSRGAIDVWSHSGDEYAARDPWRPGCRKDAP